MDLSGILVGINDERPLTIWELTDIPIGFIVIIAVIGVAFKKAIFKKLFWGILFILYMFWGILFTVYSPHNVYKSNMVIAVISLIICLPGYIALFLYGYRSKEIWNK